MIEREREKLTIDRLRTELRARDDLLKESKSSKSSNTTFLTSGTKRKVGRRRRGKCGKVSGKKKGAMGVDSNGQESSSGVGGSSGAPSEKQGEPTRCNTCKETRHKWFKCPNRIISVFCKTGHDHPNS